MFSIQCHYYWEKDITFISHSFKNIWTEQHKKELLILTKSCPFFLDFLSSMGNNRVPPNSRSVQKTRTEQQQKNQSWRVNGESMQQWFHCHVLHYSPLLSLSPHGGFSGVSPFAHGSKTDVTPPWLRYTDTHTSQLKTTNGKRDTGTRRKHLPGN